MSFDLYFCRRTDEKLDVYRVYDHFSNAPGFQMHGSPDSGFQTWYQNDVTGVYCSFDFKLGQDDPEDALLLAPGFTNTGLSFNLNYFRPSFFAHEVMPLVEALAAKFALLVLDPQESSDEIEVPRLCVAAELTASWEKHNECACGVLTEDIGDTIYAYYPRDRAMDWWTYTKNKRQLQETLGQDIFVPEIFLTQLTDRPLLSSVVLWTDALPQVFPVCDLILKQVTKRTWRGKMVPKLRQIISYDKAHDSLAHLLRPVPGSTAQLKMLPHERSREIRTAFNLLTGPPFELTAHKWFASDGYVDVKIPERLA